MAHGGKRTGAGRKPGSRNRRTVEQEAAITESGVTPLEFLTEVFRNEENALDTRIDAAKAAAPYCHAKLSSVEMSGPEGGPVEFASEIVIRGVRADEG